MSHRRWHQIQDQFSLSLSSFSLYCRHQVQPKGSNGSMVAAEARERFSLQGDRVGHGRSVQRIVHLDQGEVRECRGRGLIPKNSFCREDFEVWGLGFPAREENWTRTREEERQAKRQSKLLSLYVQIIARMSHYSAHYNRYHSFYTHISLVCRNKLLCLLILKKSWKISIS